MSAFHQRMQIWTVGIASLQISKHDQDQVIVITAQAIVKYESKHGIEDPQRSDVTIPDPESIWWAQIASSLQCHTAVFGI